jgi:hypothetical protein
MDGRGPFHCKIFPRVDELYQRFTQECVKIPEFRKIYPGMAEEAYTLQPDMV